MFDTSKRLNKIEYKIGSLENQIDKQKNEKKFEKIPELPRYCDLCQKIDFQKPLRAFKWHNPHHLLASTPLEKWDWIWVCEDCFKGKK